MKYCRTTITSIISLQIIWQLLRTYSDLYHFNFDYIFHSFIFNIAQQPYIQCGSTNFTIKKEIQEKQSNMSKFLIRALLLLLLVLLVVNRNNWPIFQKNEIKSQQRYASTYEEYHSLLLRSTNSHISKMNEGISQLKSALIYKMMNVPFYFFTLALTKQDLLQYSVHFLISIVCFIPRNRLHF